MSIPPLAAATFWIALILGMTAAFFVFVRKWAARRQQSDAASASDLLARFRELHDQGELDDLEFQKIKERLRPQLRTELGNGADAGSVADGAEALKETARTLLAGWSGGAGERETTGAARGAAREDCDATPPSGGDSTEERR